MKKTVIALFLVLILLSLPLFARTGGPDSFGYRFIDSDEPGGPTFEWLDIEATGTAGPSGDDSYRVISLPSAFEYYGDFYTQVTISTNGWVALGSWSTSSLSCDTIPSTSIPQSKIGLCHMDMHTGTGSIKYKDMGDGRFVISYIGVRDYTGSGEQFWMQVVFDYSRKSIRLNYQHVESPTSTYREGFVGIENETGTVGLCYGKHMSASSPLHDSLSITFRSDLIVSPPYFNDCYSSSEFETDGAVNDWELGRPMTVGPTTTHSFPYCWCTKRVENYSTSSNSILYPPRMSIAGCGQPIFDWWQWMEADSNFDGGLVEISTDDGISWSPVEPENGYTTPALGAGSALAGYPAFTGNIDEWEYQSIDLSPFISYGEVWLRFHFAANTSTEQAGWYVDDIGIHDSYGYLTGYVDLDYRDNDNGAIVEIPELGLFDITDATGYYFIDSVKVGVWDIVCSSDSFATQETLGIAFARQETTYIDFLLPPMLFASNFDTNSAGGVATPLSGWEWGRPDTLVAPPYAAHSESLCWGTNLSGNYINYASWTLDFQVFLAANNPHMQLFHWYKFAGEYAGYLWDGGNVKVRAIQDSTWTLVYPVGGTAPIYGYDGMVSDHNSLIGGEPAFGGETHGDFWHQVVLDMSDFGMDTAIIRFEVGADGAGTSRGWYIDDIIITDYSIGVEEDKTGRPEDLTIGTYPNPFNAKVNIEFDNPAPGPVSAKIYDIRGSLVDVLLNEDFMFAGSYKLAWDGSNSTGDKLPSGVYLVKISTDKKSTSATLLMVK